TVYRQGLEVKLPAAASGKVKLGWQGCADAGLCYPPQTLEVDLGGAPAVAASNVATTSNGSAQDQVLANDLQHKSWGLG
ncbi:protein-disulfide reductase DsbD domain-containing protein, partial [Pseudomonas sp. JV245A]